ncbi:syntaxin-6 [Notothenia coriiceps]|uniref:Syntaxin-6 n=2 Tax=Notothenioidei TaxID=8205 RepID=A0A6I9Q613_9TELE|nr:PREDICTED: syntaxin-6 [Notothenia coriiceps]
MSMEDPFFVVKGEVQKAVNASQMCYVCYREVQKAVNASQMCYVCYREVQKTLNASLMCYVCYREVQKALNASLMCYVCYREVQKTLNASQMLFFLTVRERIVESNPKKFNLDMAELLKRKAFITSTRQTVKEMKEQMSSPGASSGDRKNHQALLGERGPSGPIWQPGGNKYSRLDSQLQNANSQCIEEQQGQQQLIAEQQDEQLELVSGTIGVLKNMSERIGMELDEQSVMLDDFTHEVDNTHSRLDNVMKKLAKVSHMTSDRRQWCAIGVLLGILFIVLLLFFIL